jgi:hypothetical protein
MRFKIKGATISPLMSLHPLHHRGQIRRTPRFYQFAAMVIKRGCSSNLYLKPRLTVDRRLPPSAKRASSRHPHGVISPRLLAL